jgi:hypothetical protein
MKLAILDPTLAHRPDIGSSVSDRAKGLRDRELADLSPGDLAFCLRQSIALPHVIPIALDLAAEQSLLEAEGYPGDLLISLLHAAQNNSFTDLQLSELRDICSSALAGAETIAETVVPAASAFVARYDGA